MKNQLRRRRWKAAPKATAGYAQQLNFTLESIPSCAFPSRFLRYIFLNKENSESGKNVLTIRVIIRNTRAMLAVNARSQNWKKNKKKVNSFQDREIEEGWIENW